MKNIILLTIDALRYDALGIHLDQPDITPHLNAFAEHSYRFSSAFSCGPYTRFSFPALFTSWYASQATRVVDKDVGVGISDRATSWVEILKKHHYQTAGFLTNAYLTSFFGYHRGFNHFEDCAKPFHPYLNQHYPKLDRLFSKVQRKIMQKTPLYGYELDSGYINQRVKQWFSINREQPFFLWIHYMDAHSPYLNDYGLAHKAIHHQLTPKEIDILKNAYRKSVHHCDTSFGKLIGFLKSIPSWANTVMIVTADHGEEFNDHGDYFHKGKLYDELLHVPLFIRLPHHTGKNIDDLVSLLDIGPTILSLIGIKAPSPWRGQSFFNPHTQSFSSVREYIVAQSGGNQARIHGAVRTKKYKYINNQINHSEELYNINHDPKEKKNIINANSDLARDFRKILYRELGNPNSSV